MNDPLVNDPSPMDLSGMVEALNADGVSYKEMEKRSERAGHFVSKPSFQKLGARTATSAPTEERLRGIAAALRVPLPVVQLAAARQFFGYEDAASAGWDEDTRVVVAFLGEMAPAERRRWRAMVQAAAQVDGE